MRIYNSKGAPEELNSSKRPMQVSYADELAATGVVAALAAYGVSRMSILPNVREALYNARHAGQTVSEIVRGGSVGMRSAKNLEEALAIVEQARGANVEAGRALESYLVARKDLTGQLTHAYVENETLAREAERLKLQAEGALKSVFTIGDSLKPNAWKENVDSIIIKMYGLKPTEAIEKSGKVKEFYEHARKFYDAREKNEHTVKEFCDYLAKVKDTSESQNMRFNELFPNIIARVKEGYTVENGIFTQRRSRDFSESRVAKTSIEVKNFRKSVDGTYAEVRMDVPIAAYSETNWVDFVTNPVSLGLTTAMVGYAASRFLLPRIVRDKMVKILAAPVMLPVKGIKKVGTNLINRLKKNKSNENNEDKK